MSITSIDNIIYGGPIEHRITKDEKSLGEFFVNRLRKLGNRIVLIDGVTGTEIKASKLLEDSIAVARNLLAFGIKEGDRIGICVENRPEFANLVFGIIFLNATVTPLNALYSERELQHALHLSKPKLVFVSAATVSKVSAATQKTQFVKHIICFDDIAPSKYVLLYSKLPRIQKENEDEYFTVNRTSQEDNLVAIMYSSGTTGLPKGVQLKQSNILLLIDILFKSPCFTPDATVLSVIPWFHSYGLLCLMMLASIGAKLVFLPKFEERSFLGCIQRYRAEVCHMVPPLMNFMAKHPLVDQFDLSSLKIMLCGAAPLSEEIENAVKRRIGVSTIFQAYGMSETTASVLLQTEVFNKPGSVGTVVPATYAKVIDIETGKPLGPNKRGELCFKGPLIMKGYVGDEKATKQIIDDEGWLRTGDIGYYDEEFNFYIVDRIKELIKYKGYQVPPAEIESLLLTNPKIKDAAVIGLPDEESGELPLAFVVKIDPSLTEQDVIRFVAERASPAKKLRGGVHFIDEIPKNPSGKILRRLLREKVKYGVKTKL